MRRSTLAAALVLTGCACAAEPPALSPEAVQLALRTLQSSLPDPATAGFDALNRFALEGLLKAHPRLAWLESTAPGATRPALFTAEAAPGVLLVRPATLTADEAEAARKALTSRAPDTTRAVILDLRRPGLPPGLDGAAAWAALFTQRDLPLWKTAAGTVTAPAAAAWRGRLVVLIDAGTAPGAAVLALALQHARAGIVAGRLPQRAAAGVASLPLPGNAGTLHFAAAAVRSPDDATDWTAAPPAPDVVLTEHAADLAAVIAAQERDGLAATLTIPDRPRRSEASLIDRTDPELAWRLAPAKAPAPLTDPALVQALAILAADRFLPAAAEEVRRAGSPAPAGRNR